SIVNIALPTLVKVFNTTFATVQWVVLSYVLVLTALMLGAARLGDMYDKKKLYQGGLVIFIIGSLLCGLAPDENWLIGFRALQGLGATFMQALGSAIITEVFPANERGRALGITGSIVSVGIAICPPLGGMLFGTIGWHSIFFVNVPVGLLTFLVVSRFVPTQPVHNRGERCDIRGALVLFATLGAYALGMTRGQDVGFTQPGVLALLGGAVLGLALFIVLQRRSAFPMVDLSLFGNRLFSANLLMGFLVFIVLSASFITPFLLEDVLGYSVQMVGLFMMASPIMIGVAAPVAGLLSDRFGSRVISLVGLLIAALGCFGISTLTADVTPLGIVLRLAPLGLGFGLFQSPNNSAIMGAAPRKRLGVASGLMSLSRTLGNTTGLPLIGTIFTAQVLLAAGLPVGSPVTGVPAQALVDGVTGTYRIAILFILAAAGLGLYAWRADEARKAASAAADAE
ncbi:MAG: MFS transporter, partial [Anaerolineae bacterium]|nr:MFS transporter [Anaerolineae bacterium]